MTSSRDPRSEGNGTRTDYVVNHDGKKLRSRSGNFFLRKSRNSSTGGVGAHGKLTRSSNGLSPETNTNA